MSNFSMISNQGAGFAAPQGFAADLLGFANRWQTASDAGRASGLDLMRDVYAGNQAQMDLNNQGTMNLLGQTEATTALMQQGNQQFQQQVTAFVNTCAANGWSTPECREFARANNIQIPQQQALTGSTFTGADYSMNSPAYSGLGLR
jgi:hypothetical protein